jgi:hypothetical protein
MWEAPIAMITTGLIDVSNEMYAIPTVKNSHARDWNIYIETIN